MTNTDPRPRLFAARGGRCAVAAWLLVTAGAVAAGQDRPTPLSPESEPAIQRMPPAATAERAASEGRGGPQAGPANAQASRQGLLRKSRRPLEGARRAESAEAGAGADSSLYRPPDFGPQTDFRALLSRVFVATVGVLIACWASIWLARRFLAQTGEMSASAGSLKLLARLPVSRRGCVQLIQADDTRLVVTIDGGAVKSVMALTESFGKTLDQAADDSEPEAADALPLANSASWRGKL